MKILILEDHPLVAKGVRSVLEEVFSEAKIDIECNLNDVISEIEFKTYDLVLVDLCIKGETSFDFLEKSIRYNKDSKHLILTSSIRKDYFEKAFSYDIDGYLVKECMPEDLIYAVKSVLNNRKFIDPVFYEIDMKRKKKSKVILLSPREKEILRMLGRGKSNKQIAIEAFITVNTVKKHITNIFNKMEFNNRNEAIMFCQSHYV